ncbi:MAG: FAD-dependent oxidoreductase [Rhodospirillales bacterium]|nr:FAD-dependent oxidoreductase [Rhodospirillales bacterium]
MNESALNYRRYQDGDASYDDLAERIFTAGGRSPKCPTYVHRTPPCQGACPSGHDIRAWMNVIRGIDAPAEGMSWQEDVFWKMVNANPFPALMGRTCPALCQEKCNRNDVDDHLGINAIEHYIGDWALESGLKFPKPENETGKRVAIVGGGPAGLSCAYQLRRAGHSPVVFEAKAQLGGMLQYGLSGHRCPRDIVHKEIQRVLDMGVEARTNTTVGVDVSIEDLEKEFDAIFWGIGAWSGNPVPVPGWDEAENCIDGLAFLRAFNEGRLQYLTGRTLIIGGGNTAMDCAGVGRRLGTTKGAIDDALRPEKVVAGEAEHPETPVSDRTDGDIWIVYRRPLSMAPADQHEKDAVIDEGVEIHEALAPVEVILDGNGRARALKVIKADWSTGKMVTIEGSEFEIEADLIIAATGQSSVFEGIEVLDNGKGLVAADGYYQVAGKPGHFVGGDAIYPDLLTTAIGHGWKAAEGIDKYVRSLGMSKRPRVDVHRFDMEKELDEAGKAPTAYDNQPMRGTDSADCAIHNYADRSDIEVIKSDRMYLGHFDLVPRVRRDITQIGPNCVGDTRTRLNVLTEEQVIEEAKRCMSCGMCFECDNCVVYCPQDAVFRRKKDERSPGRYVDTDYAKCIGCHICKDVCPTGYIHMGLGE